MMNVKTEIKERPIIFSSAMIRAILEGRKTQTRRVIKIPEYGRIKPATPYSPPNDTHNGGVYICFDTTGMATWRMMPCPYGQAGDRLWVRETCQYAYLDNTNEPNKHTIIYRADLSEEDADAEQCDWDWKPSIHMPRWSSRITLEITDIRVERLQEISHEDAIAEGAEYMPAAELREQRLSVPQIVFAGFWDLINGKKYPWGSNPWVWVISFNKILNA